MVYKVRGLHCLREARDTAVCRSHFASTAGHVFIARHNLDSGAGCFQSLTLSDKNQPACQSIQRVSLRGQHEGIEAPWKRHFQFFYLLRTVNFQLERRSRTNQPANQTCTSSQLTTRTTDVCVHDNDGHECS